ncbi:MAG: hypothetical protein J3Q66DRAFT_138658 [Benniella sp.]|nr:MAG: hypothetical protein J3Q66DRAFT_138658 [Benniella sp.]
MTCISLGQFSIIHNASRLPKLLFPVVPRSNTWSSFRSASCVKYPCFLRSLPSRASHVIRAVSTQLQLQISQASTHPVLIGYIPVGKTANRDPSSEEPQLWKARHEFRKCAKRYRITFQSQFCQRVGMVLEERLSDGLCRVGAKFKTLHPTLDMGERFGERNLEMFMVKPHDAHMSQLGKFVLLKSSEQVLHSGLLIDPSKTQLLHPWTPSQKRLKNVLLDESDIRASLYE